MIELTLSWPDKVLFPNLKVHWSTVNPTRQVQKKEAWALTLDALSEKWPYPAARIHYTFHGPDQRRRDLDSLLIAMKGATDGIATALGIDDSTFAVTIEKGEARPRYGEVSVRIEPVGGEG